MGIGSNIKTGFLKIWKDSVWSKVIAGVFLATLAVIWAKITNHTWKEIYSFIIDALSFKFPVFIFLSIIAAYFIARKLIHLFKNKKDPFWDAQIGNYTFKELHNILLTEKMPVRTVGMEISGRNAPQEDLLFLFRLYYTYLNKGVEFGKNIGDGGYLYSVLAPRLLGFGLVESYLHPYDDLPDRKYTAYKTSELGHKFHAGLDKLILAEKLKKKENRT